MLCGIYSEHTDFPDAGALLGVPVLSVGKVDVLFGWVARFPLETMLQKTRVGMMSKLVSIDLSALTELN